VIFRHAVYDGLFSGTQIQDAADVWPAPDWPGWNAVYATPQQRKRTCNIWEVMPEECRDLLREMLMLDVSVFAPEPLVPDNGLWGGGMQDMGPGEWLSKHLDADFHRQSGLARRLNAILFLSPWRDGWGGELELYDAAGSRPLVTISPHAGRLVLFGTGDDTWHAVQTCGARRKTLACWWYGRADGTGKRDRAQFAQP
jgi:hypothetical protein